MAARGAVLIFALSGLATAQATDEIRHLDSRLELLMDDYLIERMEGVTRKLHAPEWRGSIMTFDRPWERAGCFHFNLFRDEAIYRMYYRASGPRSGTTDEDVPNFGNAKVTCFVESKDGIHWSAAAEQPILVSPGLTGQNARFWDAYRSRYVEFVRGGFRDGHLEMGTRTSRGASRRCSAPTSATIATCSRTPGSVPHCPRVSRRIHAYDTRSARNAPGKCASLRSSTTAK